MIELFYTVFLQRLLCLWKNFVFNFHMISKIIEYYEVKIIRYCLNCSIIPLWNAGWKGIYTRSPYKLNFNHELTWKVMVNQGNSAKWIPWRKLLTANRKHLWASWNGCGLRLWLSYSIRSPSGPSCSRWKRAKWFRFFQPSIWPMSITLERPGVFWPMRVVGSAGFSRR